MINNVTASLLRANQAYCEQLADKQTLNHSIAFHSADWPSLGEVNQVREVLLASSKNALAAVDEVDDFYAQRNLRCLRWSLSVEQSEEAIAPVLEANGYQRRAVRIMGLADWPTLTGRDDIRILPARAMRAAYRATFLTGATTPNAETLADAANERLDDAQMDVFVIVHDDQPVARGALYSVGDIACVRDVFVVPDARRTGYGRSMMCHLLKLAHRVAPRVCCLAVDDQPGEVRFFESCGFIGGDIVAEFDAPAT